MEKVGASAGGYGASGTVPQRRLPTDLLPYEKSYPHPVSGLDEVAENVEMGVENLKDGTGRTETKEFECRIKELKRNGVDEGTRERTSGEITLEHLLKRMDSLGALCMRIEAHVHQALNNMERRLQLVESRHTLPNPSLPTKTEEVNNILPSGLSSLPDLCLNSFVSCPEISSVNNCKHVYDMGVPGEPCTEVHSSSVSMSNVFLGSSADCSSACAASSSSSVILPSHPVNSTPSDAILDKTMFGSLDQQIISKEEMFLGNSQGAASAKEEAGSVISGNFNCEHPTPAKTPALSIDEALALALSAFSASIGAADASTEVPCCSSGLENSNVDGKDVRYSGGIGFDATQGLSSHKVATTAVCTAAFCGSSEVDITDDNEVCYDDDIVFGAVEGVRYISQEGMDSVPYGSSQASQDARHVLYRRGKIGDCRDDIAANIKQTCKIDAEIMINQQRELMLSVDKIEGRLCNSEMASAGKDSDSCRQEYGMVHAGQEQLQPSEQREELECSKQWPKHTHLISEEGHDLVVDKSSAFIPVTGKCESDIFCIEGICSNLDNEARKAETSIESNISKQSCDKSAMSKLHTDLPSLLDVSFTVSDTCQMRMPLEALLYNPTPEQHRETVCLQESTELGPLMNISEPMRPHGLFFVEDEDLRDFIIPSLSTLIAPVSTGNREDQGMVPAASPNFESLL